MARIRDARLEDVPGIVDVHIGTWQVAYAGQLPDELLAAQEDRRAERTEMWQRAIRTAAEEQRRVLVAEDEGHVVGFVSAGPSREDRMVGEIYAVYVDAKWWDRGVGRELFAQAIAWLADAGFPEAMLWVLDSNARARRFYEAAGWRADGGTQTEVMRGTPVHEVRYRTRLSAPR